MEKNDGGPAFPTDNERQTGDSSYHFTGMSLRDWFAGQALAGYVSQPMCPSDTTIAQECYALADAMLADQVMRDVMDTGRAFVRIDPSQVISGGAKPKRPSFAEALEAELEAESRRSSCREVRDAIGAVWSAVRRAREASGE